MSTLCSMQSTECCCWCWCIIVTLSSTELSIYAIIFGYFGYTLCAAWIAMRCMKRGNFFEHSQKTRSHKSYLIMKIRMHKVQTLYVSLWYLKKIPIRNLPSMPPFPPGYGTDCSAFTLDNHHINYINSAAHTRNTTTSTVEKVLRW